MNNKLQELVCNVSIESFGRPFEHIAIYNKRLISTGGRFHRSTKNLDFNPRLATEHEVLIGIIKHELCHYHLYIQGKGFQHKDKEFKHLLKKVDGLRFTPKLECNPSSVKHQPPVPLHKYVCTGCCIYILRKRRFNVDKFACKKCKGKFKQCL